MTLNHSEGGRMMTTQQQQSKTTKTLVEEELRRVNANRFAGAARNISITIQALGIMEIIFGAAAIFSPAFGSAYFAVLLGGAVLVSGVINIVASLLYSSGARLVQGLIAAIAGVLMIAHPLFGLAFLTALIGVYLIGTGITRFFEPNRTPLSIVNGIVGIVFGIVILLSFSNANPVLGALLVGINLIVNGIYTANRGTLMMKPVNQS
jgi:uncharacterized membrane protein HdeD (DUF308 family)